MELAQFISAILTGLITGAFAAGAIYAVFKTEMKYMRRDVDHAHKRIDRCDDNQRGHACQ